MVLHATYPQTLCPTADMQPTCSSDECPFLQVRLQTLLKQYLFTDSATLPFHRHFTWELSVTENPSSKCVSPPVPKENDNSLVNEILLFNPVHYSTAVGQ